MSYNNSDKEFYFSLYLKFYKERLEKALNVKLKNIELEKNFYGRKVDLYAVIEDGRELFAEIQLSTSDTIHLEQISKIIQSIEINNVMIVWVATEFKPSMFDKIEEKINASCKNIYFMALKLNKRVIDYLQILNNNTFVNQVIENLKIINEVENQFKVIEIFYRLQDESNMVCSRRQEVALDLSKKQDAMKYLFLELRSQISYYPSIHRDKKLDNCVIVLAGGKSSINYFIGISRKNLLFVEIRFGEKQKELFEIFKERQEAICDKLDYMAEFDVENMKIGTYLYFSNNKRNMLIKHIARVADKYIRCFSPYLFPNNAEESN